MFRNYPRKSPTSSLRIYIATLLVGIVALALLSSCSADRPVFVTPSPFFSSAENNFVLVAAETITDTLMPPETWVLVSLDALSSSNPGFRSPGLNAVQSANAVQSGRSDAMVLTQKRMLGKIPSTAAVLVHRNMLHSKSVILGNFTANKSLPSKSGQVQVFLPDSVSSPGQHFNEGMAFMMQPGFIVDVSTSEVQTATKDTEYRLEFPEQPCPNCIPACDVFPFSCFCLDWPWCEEAPPDLLQH